MGEMKPTPGPWWTDEYGTMRHGHARARDTVPVHGVALIGGNIDTERGLQANSNTRLLFEAGTVFHNTGLSPVQLVEMVRELGGVLQAAVDCDMVPKSSANDGGASKYSTQVHVSDRIRAALAKCEGVGNG